MEGSRTGWWHRHGWTVAILLAAFGISFTLRTIWSYPIIAQWGPLFTYGGGSDSFYHSRVMTYIIQNHQNLVHDPLLKFPVGATNPREPLFDWMNAVLGIIFAPLFGGNAVVAGSWFLDLQAPLWAALGVFPVYLIGREVSGRRTGLIAAVIFPFLSANIDSSIFGYANYLPFYTFIILVTVYSYLRTVKSVGSRRWVESYRHPRQYWPAVRAFLRTERSAVKWGVFTGVSLGALALAWQGYTYAVVVIGVSLFVAMIAERVRRVDSFGMYVATWIVGLVGFSMEFPYYFTQYGSAWTSYGFQTFFLLPAGLFFGVLLLLLPFLLLRDLPWVFSVPLLVVLVAATAAGLAVLSPTTFTNVVTGQGYFVKNLIYSTVAEAQAPSIDQLIIGYGVVTFFLAFVGLALFVYQLVHGRFKRYHVVFLVFSVLSIYLPVSAAKFFLVGSPIFALLPAEALRRALDLGGYPELRRTVVSLSDRRSQFGAFRKAFKARHVIVMVLVVGLILPNVWISVDAGIPGNSKSQYAQQVASTVPSWLQQNSSTAAAAYFGAAGSTLDTPNQYDSAGYNWLAQQDSGLPPAKRPAFVSWWDYGFQAIAQGDHPSVADNFQNGIDPAGQFLLSQNESQAIGVLITTLLQAEMQASGLPYLPPGLNQILAADGLDLAQLHTLLANTSTDYSLVVAHPERYLPVNAKTITDDNAMYLAMAYFLATSLSLPGVAKLYNDVQQYTGWSIRYAMSDSRLFPFYGYDTGIYYAPADLTGRIINAAGLPVTFFNVSILGTDGNVYPAGQLPSGVSPAQYQINRFAPFFNSMIYHIYIGYNGSQAGLGTGVPGLEGSQQVVSSPIMPGWMLHHFEVVYQTAYYCPQKNATGGSGCFAAQNLPTAVSRANASHGTADTSAGSYFGGGESMLEYYPGQTMLGDVVLPGGTPVSGARVTVADGWGVPHMTAFTASDGSFSLILPPGNDTVNITMGSFTGLRQQGNILLKSLHINVPNAVGMSFDAPNLVETVQLAPAKVQGFVYWNANNSSSFVPAVDPVIPGAHISLWGPNGLARLSATTDASGAFAFTNIPPGVYNYSVQYGGHNYTEPQVFAEPNAGYNATAGLSPGYFFGTVHVVGGAQVAGAMVTLSNTSGVVSQAVSNASGAYRIGTAGPGNYTLTAFGPTAGYRSAGVGVSANGTGVRVHTNLTVEPMSSVSFSLVANGAPAAGIPVRFVPIASYGNLSNPPIRALANSTSNGTVVASTASGTVTATLPAGSYSVYALGYVGNALYAGLTDLAVSPALPNIAPSLTLQPGLTLRGTVAQVGTSSNVTKNVVIAYAAAGGEAVTWTPTNGSFSFVLPAGVYSLLTLTGTLESISSSIYTGLVSVTLDPTTSPVRIVPATTVFGSFSVGTILADGANFPAGSALVTLSVGTAGPSIPTVASPNGTVAVYAPATLPGGASYCVGAQSAGFVSATKCDVTPTGLAHMTTFPLTLANVSVQLTVQGLPGGTTTTVNFTAESPSAESLKFTGGPTFAFSARPGVYGVGARATIANGTVVYLPSTILSTTIPLGATYSNLTLYLLPQVNATGALSVSPLVPLGNVTVSLSSAVMNVTVNGTAFTHGFHAAPGVYSVRGSFASSGVNYTNFTRLTVGAGGTVTPALSISVPGVHLAGTFTNQSGVKVPLNTTVTLVGPGGAVTSVLSHAGTFSISVPPGLSYAVFANSTTLTPGPNGSFYQSWSVVPGSACTPAPSNAACQVRLVPTTQLTWLNGTLTSPGLSDPVAGSVVLIGPFPSLNVTSLAAPSGSFSLRVLPGAYSVYADGTGSAHGRAALGSALALPFHSSALSLSLAPTWLDTISIGGPNGSLVGLGPVTLSLADGFGHRLVYTGISPSSQLAIDLPSGTYRIAATSSGTSYGVPTTATGSATVTVSTGNLATLVQLHYATSYAVQGVLVGPSTVTVSAGGVAAFGFSVRATGNIPVVVHPIGTPSYWTFDFSFASATLTPGLTGTNLSGQVLVHVPAGTAVSHPGVTIEFALANGTVVGRVAPAPTIHVLPYYGVVLGQSSTPSQVGPSQVVQPFYLTNTGNTYELVRLTVVDAARLAGLGWKAVVQTSAHHGAGVAGLSVGQNATYFVEINATGKVFLAPGSVTVSASVVNASGSVAATGTISIPYGSVHPAVPNGGSALVVTGPSVGAAPNSLPDWLVPLLVFLPAIALAVGVITYRWWRTRRWTRR